MPSQALNGLLAGLEEVRDLQKANPTPAGGLPDRPKTVRAINRASVVLLASHLERYLRSVNEEAVDAINNSTIEGPNIPINVRLLHSQGPIDDLAEMEWKNRGDKLIAFLSSDGWLWGPVHRGRLDHEQLVKWMRSPSPQRIVRLFRQWGLEDIFDLITRQPHTRQRMWLKLNELVDKRNNIAHGDLEAQATYNDIRGYMSVVRDFACRSDRYLSRAIGRVIGTVPW